MKIVVCGGGISGLASVYYLNKALARTTSKPYKIFLIEKSNNVGGWMKTNVRNGDRKVYQGAINEHGPRSVRTAGLVGNNTLQLISDIGMESNVIPVKSDDIAAKQRLLYVNKKLHILPNSLLSACKKQEPFSNSLARSVVGGLFKKVPPSYETMSEICSERFGQEVADYLVSSFVRGVFAADSKQLSMKAAFPPLWGRLGPKQAQMPRRPSLKNPDLFNKSLKSNPFVKRAKQEKWTQWAVDKGFSYLTDNLEQQLAQEDNIEIIKETNIDEIMMQNNGKMMMSISRNSKGEQTSEQIENIDHTISALPSYALSRILKKSNKQSNIQISSNNEFVSSTLGIMLSHIKWVDVGVVNVEFSGKPNDILPHVGFGHLVPSSEPSSVLGIVYDSCAFPQHDRLNMQTTRMTCMMGGSWFQELFGDPNLVSNQTLESAALESISQQLGIHKDPMNVITTLCQKCIPTYRVGHTDLVENIEDFISEHDVPLSLVGASYWGVSINDCIFNSRVAVNNILKKHKLSS
ncbi:protoporphyrinogen oxidase-like [Ciona intestinalis]